ncbi:hypothetical protein HDU76_005984 [Blyttiomyces sp. JEL0837]|nr:hypothetical protein HDU76_005984 [Blyttiomyces sp. JEL0837]
MTKLILVALTFFLAAMVPPTLAQLELPPLFRYLINSFCAFASPTLFPFKAGIVTSGFDCALECINKGYLNAAVASNGLNTVSCFCGNTYPNNTEVDVGECAPCGYDFASQCGKLNYKAGKNTTFYIYSNYTLVGSPITIP